MEEVVRAMNWCIETNKAYYWCGSEWSAQQYEEAWGIANRLGLIGPVADQCQYNMFHRERLEKEYSPLYKNYGMGTTVCMLCYLLHAPLTANSSTPTCRSGALSLVACLPANTTTASLKDLASTLTRTRLVTPYATSNLHGELFELMKCFKNKIAGLQSDTGKEKIAKVKELTKMWVLLAVSQRGSRQ